MFEKKFYRLIGWEYELGTPIGESHSAKNEIINDRYDYEYEDEKQSAYQMACSDLLKRVLEIDKDFDLCGTICNHTIVVKSRRFKKPIVREYCIDSMVYLTRKES